MHQCCWDILTHVDKPILLRTINDTHNILHVVEFQQTEPFGTICQLLSLLYFAQIRVAMPQCAHAVDVSYKVTCDNNACDRT